MKSIKANILKGTLAASVLVGAGVAGLVHQAFAADDAVTPAPTSTTSPAPKEPGRDGMFKGGKGAGGHHGIGHGGEFGFKGGNLAGETATLLGVEESVVKDELKQGKTLAQIAQEKAGLSKEDYLAKLTDAVTKSIDKAVADGKITQEQADKQKAGLAERLKLAVENTVPPQDGGPGRGRGHGPGDFGPIGGKPEEIAAILGITAQELRDGLDAGKSLAELAQEKGISTDDLVAKLKDGMTDRLKQFVEQKRQPRTKAAPASSNTAS